MSGFSATVNDCKFSKQKQTWKPRQTPSHQELECFLSKENLSLVQLYLKSSCPKQKQNYRIMQLRNFDRLGIQKFFDKHLPSQNLSMNKTLKESSKCHISRYNPDSSKKNHIYIRIRWQDSSSETSQNSLLQDKYPLKKKKKKKVFVIPQRSLSYTKITTTKHKTCKKNLY